MPPAFLNRCIWRATAGGTSDFVVDAAITGYVAPEDALNPVVEDGAEYNYFAQSDDLSEWEVGIGVYTVSDDTLTRATILDSSNAGSIVTFSAAPSVHMGGPLSQSIRVRLTADTDFYVETSGDDSTGDGSSGTPWETLQHAYDTIVKTYDFAGFKATINLGSGTFAGFNAVEKPVGATIEESITIQGAGRANTEIAGVSDYAVHVENNLGLYVRNLKVSTTGSLGGLFIQRIGLLKYDDIEFGACAGAQIEAAHYGETLAVSKCYVTGGAQAFIRSRGKAIARGPSEVEFSNSPAYSTAYYEAFQQGMIRHESATYTNGGTVTGSKFKVDHDSVVLVGTTTVANIPGNSDGTVVGGTVYSATDILFGPALRISESLATRPTIDTSNRTYTLAGGADMAIASNDSGFLVVTDHSLTGSTAVFVLGGGGVALLGQSNGTTWVASSTPSGSQWGVYLSSPNYRIKNGTGSNGTFTAQFFNTRASW